MERTQVHKTFLVVFKTLSTLSHETVGEEYHCYLWAIDLKDAHLRFRKYKHPGLHFVVISVEESDPGPEDEIFDTF